MAGFKTNTVPMLQAAAQKGCLVLIRMTGEIEPMRELGGSLTLQAAADYASHSTSSMPLSLAVRLCSSNVQR